MGQVWLCIVEALAVYRPDLRVISDILQMYHSYLLYILATWSSSKWLALDSAMKSGYGASNCATYDWHFM
jgi:hypothetical protein